MKKRSTNIKIYKKIFAISCLSLILVKDEINYITDNYIPYFNSGNINKYNDSKKNEINISLKKSYIPQGICLVDSKILVTLYEKDYKDYSCIYVIDKETNKNKKVCLDIKAHCGGITYDEKNKNIWVSANDGYINCYKLEDVLNKKNIENIKSVDCSNNLINHKGNESSSYLTYYQDKLFVGNFNVFSLETIMKVYEVDNTKLTYQKEIKMPNCIQGITFKDNKMILSRSYGEKNTSQILIYDYNELINNYKKEKRKEITTPSLQQQIILDENELYILFESNSDIYQNEKIKSEDITIIDYKKLTK